MQEHAKDPQTPAEALQRFYAAEARYVASGGGDFTAVAGATHPDFVALVPDCLPYGGRWCGHDGLREFIDAFADAWEALDVRDVQVLTTAQDAVVVLLTMHARSRRTGRSMRMPLCQVNRFRDGRLSEVRAFYSDTATVLRTLGLGQA